MSLESSFQKNNHIFFPTVINGKRCKCLAFTQATIWHYAYNIDKCNVTVEHNLVTEGMDTNEEWKILRFYARLPAMLIAQVADGKDVVGMEKLKYHNKEITITVAKEVRLILSHCERTINWLKNTKRFCNRTQLEQVFNNSFSHIWHLSLS